MTKSDTKPNGFTVFRDGHFENLLDSHINTSFSPSSVSLAYGAAASTPYNNRLSVGFQEFNTDHF